MRVGRLPVLGSRKATLRLNPHSSMICSWSHMLQYRRFFVWRAGSRAWGGCYFWRRLEPRHDDAKPPSMHIYKNKQGLPRSKQQTMEALFCSAYYFYDTLSYHNYGAFLVAEAGLEPAIFGSLTNASRLLALLRCPKFSTSVNTALKISTAATRSPPSPCHRQRSARSPNEPRSSVS